MLSTTVVSDELLNKSLHKSLNDDERSCNGDSGDRGDGVSQGISYEWFNRLVNMAISATTTTTSGTTTTTTTTTWY